jgi:hypothetical protein
MEAVFMLRRLSAATTMRRPGKGDGRRLVAAILAAGLVFAALATAQEKPDDDAIWKAFISWFKSAPKESDPFKGYTAKLGQEGVPEISGFNIEFYEETQGPADWGGLKSRVVRMLARKRS